METGQGREASREKPEIRIPYLKQMIGLDPLYKIWRFVKLF